MDFKSRFKEKISHVTKEGVVGAISQNSQPVTKFKVSNTNLHFKIFTKNNPELESIYS